MRPWRKPGRGCSPHVPPTPDPALAAAARRPRAPRPRVKHENRQPHGRVQGPRRSELRAPGLRAERPDAAGLIAATRGNHGQSLAYAGRASATAGRARRAHGQFTRQERRDGGLRRRARRPRQATARRPASTPSELARSAACGWCPRSTSRLVEGVATYAAELHDAVPDLDDDLRPGGRWAAGSAPTSPVRDLRGQRTHRDLTSRWPICAPAVRPDVLTPAPPVGTDDRRHLRRRRRLPDSWIRSRPRPIIVPGAAPVRPGRRRSRCREPDR